jgi:O-antigen/teichoic acid export membrane protein
MNRSIASGFLSIVTVKFLLIGLDFLSSPLLTRFLGGEYGDYAFLMSVFAIYMIFVSSGVGDGVRKYIAEERDRRSWDAHVVGFYLRLALILAAVGCLLLALGARTGFVTERFGASYRTYFYLLALLVFASQFREYTRRTLMGFGLERYSEPLVFLDKALFILVGVGLAYLGYGVPGVLAGLIVAAAATGIIGLLLINREVSLVSALTEIPSLEFPRRELLVFNGFSILLILSLEALYHVDVMMLGVFGTTEETGYYRISLTLAQFLWIVPIALQNVLLHSTSNIWSKHDRERIDRIAGLVTRYTLLFTLLLALGMAALAPVALPVIYPADYIASYVPILLLLPGCVGFALARPILAIGQGKGDLRPLVAATGGAASANVVLNGLLIPRYGMYGAAAATSISYGLMFVFHVWSARKVGFRPVSDVRIPQALLVTAFAAVPIFLLTRFLEGWAIPLILFDLDLSLLVVPPVGAAVFFAFALVFGAIDLDEVFDVLATAPDPIGSVASTLRAKLDDRSEEPEDAAGPIEATAASTDGGDEAETATARNSRSATDDSGNEPATDEGRPSTEPDVTNGADAAPNSNVLERIETLESTVERQNDRLEEQRRTLEQLLDELRRGR